MDDVIELSARLGERLHGEALGLAVEIRDFIADRRRLDGHEVAILDKIEEEGRLTTRALELMAWVIGIRAVQAGEVPELRPEWWTSGSPLCLGAPTADVERSLPPRFRDLLGRSMRLYERAERARSAALGRGRRDP